ncbi:uncharacterized protein LOC116253222 [Nymphaea colorata]|nr:uncharacterized protein LOC116253222 [Nymphaea colorata]
MAGPRGLAAMLTMGIASMLAIQCVYGEIACENLPTEMCAFSVSSAGMRCVLEKYNYGEEVKLQCRTSQVKADDIAGWVESDGCVEACGVDRSSVGISSDSLMERQFLERLCSDPCYGGCPNIVDLYFKLAAAEGIFLPKLCESLKDNPRRGMFETLSSGFVAPAPGSLPPPSEPTPGPGSKPAAASGPAPGSEQFLDLLPQQSLDRVVDLLPQQSLDRVGVRKEWLFDLQTTVRMNSVAQIRAASSGVLSRSS